MHIAVIGAGISGLGAAWALSRRHDVTVFEAAGRPGGHANTVDVACGGRTIPVDAGFIVYNEHNYPHLVQLFETLGIETEASDMSLAISLDDGRHEYAGRLAGLFGQPRNAVRPDHWRMIADIARFYREAPACLQQPEYGHVTLGDYLRRKRYSQSFVAAHLLPMAAAIWSCPLARVLDFPVTSFVRFMCNHGLLQLANRPRWRTVRGGSREYVTRIVEAFAGRLNLATAVHAVRRDAAGIRLLTARGESERFDEVVFATHADRTLAILGETADPLERGVLQRFTYTRSRAVLHGDPALMPRRRRLWSSWNVLTGTGEATTRPTAVTYWMNRLQNLPGPDLFVSLNPPVEPQPDRVHATFQYQHPVFDRGAAAAQAELPAIQGMRRVWFCGSYCGYGFHEDGLSSGLAVAAALGAPALWWHERGDTGPAARHATPLPQPVAAAAAE